MHFCVLDSLESGLGEMGYELKVMNIFELKEPSTSSPSKSSD